MFCKTYSAALCGMEAVTVQVEADVRNGLPLLQMVGALSSEVKEAKERIRVAMENSGFLLPPKRVTINLSPADIRKEGTSFDLPAAISMLAAFGYLPEGSQQQYLFTGELSLDGKLNRVNGVLPIACHAAKEGFLGLIVPEGNAKEAAVVPGLSVYGMRNLREVVEFFCGTRTKERQERPELSGIRWTGADFAEIAGHAAAKRAMLIAAAGGHHLLLFGPPGSGKTALARCMPSILPDMSFEEMLELSSVYSIAGKLPEGGYLVEERPFQAPHHSITRAALVGGGRLAKPGIISCAHNGVLFLDELPEFSPEALESLREPLEERSVTVSRLNYAYTYPADFQLLAAMNPCPCGYYPDREKCTCSEREVERYLGRLSRPLMDRIDMAAEVLPVEYGKLVQRKRETSSEALREQVLCVREREAHRFRGTGIQVNAGMGKREIERFCAPEKEGEALLADMYREEKLSTRGYYRVLKLARTIADLDKSENIEKKHLAEALGYRNLDPLSRDNREGNGI